MATPTYPVGVHRNQGEQLSLSTTVAVLGIPPDYHQAKIYVPSTAFRLHINPAIKAVRYYKASATAGTRWKDMWRNTTDRDTATGTGTSLYGATTSDYVYVCFEEPVGGMAVTVSAASDAVSTLVNQYRKNDDTWATLTTTDGTRTGGNTTLGQTGNMTWTVPTDWKRTTIDLSSGVNKTTDGNGVTTDVELDAPGTDGHWLRLSWTVALGGATAISELASINRDTSRGYYYAGIEYYISFDLRKAGSIEAILAAGTDTMDITWMRVN